MKKKQSLEDDWFNDRYNADLLEWLPEDVPLEEDGPILRAHISQPIWPKESLRIYIEIQKDSPWRYFIAEYPPYIDSESDDDFHPDEMKEITSLIRNSGFELVTLGNQVRYITALDGSVTLPFLLSTRSMWARRESRKLFLLPATTHKADAHPALSEAAGGIPSGGESRGETSPGDTATEHPPLQADWLNNPHHANLLQGIPADSPLEERGELLRAHISRPIWPAGYFDVYLQMRWNHPRREISIHLPPYTQSRIPLDRLTDQEQEELISSIISYGARLTFMKKQLTRIRAENSDISVQLELDASFWPRLWHTKEITILPPFTAQEANEQARS